MSISPFNLPRRDNWGPITAAFPGVGGGVTLVSPYTVSSLDLETGERKVVAYVATQCGDRTKHVRDATSASLLGTPVVVLVRMDATMLAVHLHGKNLVEPYHVPGREPADLPKTIASNDTELFVMTSPFTVLYQVSLETNEPSAVQVAADPRGPLCAGPSMLATRAVVGPSVTIMAFDRPGTCSAPPRSPPVVVRSRNYRRQLLGHPARVGRAPLHRPSHRCRR